MQIRLSPTQNLHIQTASDIFHLLQPAFLRQSKLNRDREHLWLMCLDHSQTPGSKSGAGSTLELLGLGTQQTVLIDAMPRFQFEATTTGKRGIVVAHNHPAGSLKPSRSDITATEKLVDASHFPNIKLLDHLIISEKEFYSFRDGGEFEKMNTENSSCSTVSWQWSSGGSDPASCLAFEHKIIHNTSSDQLFAHA